MKSIRRLFLLIVVAVSLLGCTSTTEKAYQQISVQAAKEKMDTEEVYVVDVRTKEEFAQGHIVNAINLPLDTLTKTMEYPFAQEDQVLVYCRSGNRSAQAAEKLSEFGFTHIYDFGGIQDWTYEIEQ